MSRKQPDSGRTSLPGAPRTQLTHATEILPPAELQTLFAAAHTHGEESEPDHEVGDLQQALQTAWNLMTSQQKTALMTHWSVTDILDWGAPPNALD